MVLSQPKQSAATAKSIAEPIVGEGLNPSPAQRFWLNGMAMGTAIALWAAMGCTAQTQPGATVTETGETTPIEATTAADEADFQMVTVLENLEHPWGLAWLPDGELLITERPGRLRIAREGVLDPTPIPGLPEIFAQGQGGLLDIALHPDFAENRLVYFSYAHGDSSANRTRIARATFDGETLNDWEVIFEVSQPKSRAQHFGSRLAWLPDGTLLVSIGDGGNPPTAIDGEFIRQQAQNRSSHLGKVLRLHDDGSIPADNPFVEDTEAAPEIWSYGHRNIQGLAIDPETEQVWATEHGSRGGDELNRVEAGENYGWPLVTHSREYTGGQISPDTSRPGMIDPQVVWTPAIAPSGLAIYRGEAFPAWQGNLFAGGLVSQDLRRLELDASSAVVNEVAIPIGQRVRDVRQGPDGLLYVLTDESNGQLIRLEPSAD